MGKLTASLVFLAGVSMLLLAQSARAQIDTTQLPGANIGARLTNCINALGTTGGICDSRTEISATNLVTASISITTNITWLLPPAAITFSFGTSGVGLDISGSNVKLVGQGMYNSVLDFSGDGSHDNVTVEGSGVRISDLQIKGGRLVTGTGAGTGRTLVVGPSSGSPATDNVVERVYISQSPQVGISVLNCTRCYVRNNYVLQAAGPAIQVNANISGQIARDDYVLNNVIEDSNCGSVAAGIPGNGIINVVSNAGSGAMSGVTIDGNTIRNMTNVPTVAVSGIVPDGTKWTVSSGAITLVGGQFVELTGFVCSPASPCFNGVFSVLTGGTNVTSWTITNNTSPSSSSGGTAKWGPNTGGFSIGGFLQGQNPQDTGNFEGIQINASVMNVTITNNQLFHIRSEGIVVSNGPAVVESNNLNQVGEDPLGGVGGILIGGAAPTPGIPNQSVIAKGNTITDAPYGIRLGISKTSVNLTWQLVDIEGNTVATNTGAPATGSGFRADNASAAASGQQNGSPVTVTSLSCSLNVCQVNWSPTGNTCSGTTWSVRGVPGTTGGAIPTLNGDFTVSLFVGGASCSGFKYANAGASFSNLSLNGTAYASQFVNTLIVANNDFTGASTGISLWAGAGLPPAGNIPSGTVDIHGNKELVPVAGVAGFQGFYDVYGPVPDYKNSGGIVHRFTAGHFQNLQNNVSLNNIISFPLSSGSTAGGTVHYFVDATNAATTAMCVEAGEIQFSALNDGTTKNVHVTKVPNATGMTFETQCSSTGTLAVTWTGGFGTTACGGTNIGCISINANQGVIAAPIVMHAYYDVDYFGVQDPTYLPNPPRPN